MLDLRLLLALSLRCALLLGEERNSRIMRAPLAKLAPCESLDVYASRLWIASEYLESHLRLEC
jgi:hypothetical protein